MVVLDSLKLTKNPLEPYQEVLKRQKPDVTGKPYEMEVFHNEHPKDVGDPWKGAYSQHGFWYKFHWGEQEDFDKLVAFAYTQEAYFLKYEYSTMASKCTAGGFRVLVAKTLSLDFVGGVTLFPIGNHALIGCHFVVQEYRHSGIGHQLMQEIRKHADGKTMVFNAMHHLLPSVPRYGFILQKNTCVDHYITDKPTGFPSLKTEAHELHLINSADFTVDQWQHLVDFDRKITLNSHRGTFIREFCSMESANTVALFKKSGILVGFGSCREVAGDPKRRLFIGPIYANKNEQAEVILRGLLKKYYNPEEDFEFDPDETAVYRRDVHFLVPRGNTFMKKLIEKLNGVDGTMRKERMWYQTVSTAPLPQLDWDDIFAVSDLHFSFV